VYGGFHIIKPLPSITNMKKYNCLRMPNATSQHFPQDLVNKTEYAKLSSSFGDNEFIVIPLV
jgi:hypothetical protein